MSAVRGMVACLGLVALLLWAGQPSSAGAEPLDGVVRGQVTNGTADGSSLPGAEALLLVFGIREQAQVGERSAEVDAQGRFELRDVDRDANLAYLLVIRHQGVTYAHASPFQLHAEPERQADVTVYDVTHSDAALRLERANVLVVGATEGMLEVLQMGALVNTGDRTFVTENPQDGALARGARFGLPSGALGLRMEQGFRDEEIQDAVGGVQVVAPIKPGRQEYAFSYRLPYTQASADLTQQLQLPADTFNVYLPREMARLNTGSLASAGETQFGGQPYVLFTASDLPRGALVDAQLADLPWAGGTGLQPSQLASISLGAVVLVLGAGAAAYVLRRQAPRPALKEAMVATAVSPTEERLRLVMVLAELDQRFADGGLPEAEYRAERERGKQRLRELARATG